MHTPAATACSRISLIETDQLRRLVFPFVLSPRCFHSFFLLAVSISSFHSLFPFAPSKKRRKDATQNGEWKRRVETASGNTEWKHRVETPSGNTEWKHRVETPSGNSEWKRRVETASGNSEWKPRVETATHHDWGSRGQLNTATEYRGPVTSSRALPAYHVPVRDNWAAVARYSRGGTLRMRSPADPSDTAWATAPG